LVGEKKTSQYKHVNWDRSSKKWRAQMSIHGKQTYIGLYQNETTAAMAVNQKCQELGIPLRNPNAVLYPNLDNNSQLSKYRHVFWDDNMKLWGAKFEFKGMTQNIGRFKTEVEAAIAVNRKCEEYGIPLKIQNIKHSDVYFNNGNHSSNGNESSNGKHSSNGNGQSSNGKHGSNGNGHSSNGKHGSNGNGQSSNGKYGSNGNGHSSNGKHSSMHAYFSNGNGENGFSENGMNGTSLNSLQTHFGNGTHPQNTSNNSYYDSSENGNGEHYQNPETNRWNTLSNELDQKNRIIHEKALQIQEKDETIARQQKEIDESEQIIKEQNEQIAEQNEIIKSLH
jgi:hypothetical protein